MTKDRRMDRPPVLTAGLRLRTDLHARGCGPGNLDCGPDKHCYQSPFGNFWCLNANTYQACTDNPYDSMCPA